MTDNGTMQPFEPTIRAAVNAVEARLAEIRAAQDSYPDQWQALHLESFWNRDAALVVLKPQNVHPTDMTVMADGDLQEYMGGHGVVAVLLRNEAKHIVVDCNVETATVQMTLPITAL
ncbi:hypothetical protein [Microbacterium sp. NPDC087589]|uniref:hypothetical protein n=1 Tax=Microbacterium sp. NPDC087589 TaxID=3364191 RepID=UPI00380C4F35